MSKLNHLSQTPSEIGTLANRGYRLLSKLGEGSYAKVFLSEYKTPDSEQAAPLACKVIDTNRVTKNFVTKFLPRELDILVKIHHPHIVHIHSIFQRRQKYFIFMRYAEHGDLLDFIIKHGALTEPQTRFWSRQIALALQYLHRLDIAHRDIKCENVLVTGNNNVKLCDFGFTRYTVDDADKAVLSETFCGSLSYAAPEILKGRAYDPKRSDMWAFGIMVFTMLNKAMPFDDAHATQLYNSQMKRKWKFGYRIVDKLSEQVKSLVGKMLEPDAKKRLSVEEVISSEWIAMDLRLRSMNRNELAAIQAATLAKAEKNLSCVTEPPAPYKDQTIDVAVGPDTVAAQTNDAAAISIQPSVIIDNRKINKSMSTIKDISSNRNSSVKAK